MQHDLFNPWFYPLGLLSALATSLPTRSCLGTWLSLPSSPLLVMWKIDDALSTLGRSDFVSYPVDNRALRRAYISLHHPAGVPIRYVPLSNPPDSVDRPMSFPIQCNTFPFCPSQCIILLLDVVTSMLHSSCRTAGNGWMIVLACLRP